MISHWIWSENQGDRVTDDEEVALQNLLAGHNQKEHSVVYPALG